MIYISPLSKLASKYDSLMYIFLVSKSGKLAKFSGYQWFLGASSAGFDSGQMATLIAYII